MILYGDLEFTTQINHLESINIVVKYLRVIERKCQSPCLSSNESDSLLSTIIQTSDYPSPAIIYWAKPPTPKVYHGIDRDGGMGREINSHESYRRKFLKSGVALSGSLGLAGCLGSLSDDSDERTLQLGHPVPENNIPVGTMQTGFAEKVNQKTNEEITIEVFPGGQLGSQVEMSEGVSSGTIDMVSNPLSIIFPDYGVLAYPFLYDNHEEALEGTNTQTSELAQHMNKKAREEHNVHNITNYLTGTRVIHLSDEGACTPSDLSGRKLRTAQSNYFINMCRGLGGEPTGVEVNELSSALATGNVDGMEQEYSIVEAYDLYQFLDYAILTEHTPFPMSIQINTGVWNELTDSQQEAITEAGQEQRQESAENLQSEEERVRENMRDNDITLVREEDCMEKQAFIDNMNDVMLSEFPHWEELLGKSEYWDG